jgi:outer membrane receptor protein involved in Fe transport
LGFTSVGIQDVNGDGVFDENDAFASTARRRTLELGPRTGGNRLPVTGTYSSNEWFVEAILPLVQGKAGFENLSLEAGFRSADYDVQGSTDSWKAGVSWEIVPGFRIRAMQQQAVRVPNVGELFQTTSLSPVVDCKGIYGTSCDPVPEFRSTLRANWNRPNGGLRAAVFLLLREPESASCAYRAPGRIECFARHRAALRHLARACRP